MAPKERDVLKLREGDALLDKRETGAYLRISIPTVNCVFRSIRPVIPEQTGH